MQESNIISENNDNDVQIVVINIFNLFYLNFYYQELDILDKN